MSSVFSSVKGSICPCSQMEFDLRDDNSGQDIMALLLHAADRGVSVKIIVDGINGVLQLSGSDHFHALVSHPNVEVKFYNLPNPLLPWKANLRLHDKYLIADNSVYILGGRNTNDLFLGNYAEEYNVDRDLLVYETGGDSADTSPSQLRAYFEDIWLQSCNQEITYSENADKVTAAKNDLYIHYDELTAKYPEAFAETDYYAATMETNCVTLLTNSPEAVNKEPNLWYMLCRLMSEGETVAIQTPYIVCSSEMYADLETLCQTTKVELIINAVESGANPWGCTDYLNQKEKIQATGIEIYEFFGTQSSHTKTILIDNRLSIVGSYNLDMRSTYLDTEIMLAVDCKELNQQLSASADWDKANSRHIYPDGTSEYGEEYKPIELSFGKRLFYGVLRTVTVPFRHLL